MEERKVRKTDGGIYLVRSRTLEPKNIAMCQQYGAESKHSAPTEKFACVVVVKTSQGSITIADQVMDSRLHVKFLIIIDYCSA